MIKLNVLILFSVISIYVYQTRQRKCLVLNHKYNRFVFACLLLQAAKTISLGFMNDVLIGIS